MTVLQISQNVQLLDNISHENKEIVLLGDTNIDLLKYSSNKHTTEYLDMLIANSFCPVVTLPTRVLYSAATLIDHVFKKRSNTDYIGGTLINDI